MWIKVEEELPPQHVYVLVCQYDGRPKVEMEFMEIACRLGHQWINEHDGEILDPKYGTITHWMPLPDPPNASQNLRPERILED